MKTVRNCFPLQDCSLVVAGVTAKWSNATEDNTLTDVSFSVKAGELLAVVGPVGSGKVILKTSCVYHLHGMVYTKSGPL